MKKFLSIIMLLAFAFVMNAQSYSSNKITRAEDKVSGEILVKADGVPVTAAKYIYKDIVAYYIFITSTGATPIHGANITVTISGKTLTFTGLQVESKMNAKKTLFKYTVKVPLSQEQFQTAAITEYTVNDIKTVLTDLQKQQLLANTAVVLKIN